jgi:hypothetical protein
MYPANDVDVPEASEAESSEALPSSVLDSENQDATLEAGAEEEDAEEEDAEEEDADVDDVEGVNTLNIELDAEAGGLDFAKDAMRNKINGCYYYIIF